MTPRNAYRSIFGLCFVLLIGVAVAQQNSQRAQPKSLSAGPSGWRLTADDTVGAFSFGEIIVQPGTGPEPHRHSREDELWYVLEGQLEFRIGDRGEQVIVAGPGTTVFGPRGIPHTYKALGTTPARYVISSRPEDLRNFSQRELRSAKKLQQPILPTRVGTSCLPTNTALITAATGLSADCEKLRNRVEAKRKQVEVVAAHESVHGTA